MQDRLAQPRTISGVARDMGISREYVHRLFREVETVPSELTTAIATSMMARTVETAGEGGGDADGLPGSTMDASAQADLGGIMAWKRPDPPAVEQERHLPISGSVIESPEGPTAVVGRRPSG